jgi:hypothetical protein
MRETYPPTILERKAQRLRRETGNPKFQSKLHSGRTPRALFVQSIVRPAKMLFFSPIVLLHSAFMAIIYGYLYLLFTTIPKVFQENYGFNSGTVGLAYLGIGLGAVAAVIIFASISDRLMKKMSAEGGMKPEYRLPVMMYGAPCVPIGLFWYGWSVDAHTRWIVPIIGSSFVGFGLICIFVSPPNALYSVLMEKLTNKDAGANLYGRRLHCPRRVCFGGIFYSPIAGRRLAPSHWREDVCKARSGVGK